MNLEDTPALAGLDGLYGRMRLPVICFDMHGGLIRANAAFGELAGGAPVVLDRSYSHYQRVQMEKMQELVDGPGGTIEGGEFYAFHKPDLHLQLARRALAHRPRGGGVRRLQQRIRRRRHGP